MTLTAPYVPHPVLNDLKGLWENVLSSTPAIGVPEEDERIFLFIDMNDSTMLAERMGHIKYSMYLSTFFKDFEQCRKKIGGEVYQFVGDEVILTWKFKKYNIEKCLQIVELFSTEIQKKKDWYRNEFGYVPAFKAAAHHGKVAITKIGAQKTYHGDVLNTCSRLLETASKFRTRMVVSEDVADFLPNDECEQLTDASIRGKRNPLRIFSVIER